MQRRFLILSTLGLCALLGFCGGCNRASADGIPHPALPSAPVTVSQKANVSEPLRAAAKTLFMQGLADPTGGEYREITVRVGSVWGGDTVVKTHGWVLPKQNGEDETRAVTPNGLVYSVRSVGGKASIAKDVATFLKKREEAQTKYGRQFGFGWRSTSAEGDSVSIDSPSFLYVCLLLRLGEDKAAESLYKAWSSALEPRVNANESNLRDPYFLLVNQWTWSVYDRAVCAHMRGDDALAASDAALLTQSQPLIEAEVKTRNPKQYPTNGSIKEEGSPALPFLKNLPELLADSKRRLTDSKPPALDLAALKTKPQAERIATLIQHLDEVAARQSGQPGGVGLDASPISSALIAEGEAAVEPLLDVLENDKRLTRSVSFGRDFFQDRNLLSVRSAAFTCFVRIIGVSEFSEGRDVKSIRAWWAKNKGITAPERWFAQLADDGNQLVVANDDPKGYEKTAMHREADVDRWSAAADRILTRSDVTESGGWVSLPTRDKSKPLPAYRGELLRSLRSPSVSDVFEKRALQLSNPAEERWGFDVQRGAVFALRLYAWDPQNPRTLTTLRTVMDRCIAFENKQSKEQGHSDQYQLGGRIARLAIARVALGDTKAAKEYSTWLRSVNPEYLSHETDSALYPLMQDPQNPVWEREAAALFSDTTAVWGKLFADPKYRGNYGSFPLIGSRMLRVTTFRELVRKRLSDKTEAGTVSPVQGSPNSISFKWLDGGSMGAGIPATSAKGKPVSQKIRVCDRVAFSLQGLPGVPLWEPFAPEAKRDKQCAAIADYLRLYGPGFRETETYERPLHGFDMGSPFDSILLGIETGTTPATTTDVAESRAVFALNPDKRPRVVTDLTLPLEASWEKDPFAQTSKTADGKKHRYSRGKIYQAEEEWDGTQWRRYYGFVGTHTITKVPADQVTITDYRYLSKKSNGTSKSAR